MSISDFKNALSGGGARANRFEVVVQFPGFAASTDEIRKTAFLSTATQLPGSTLGSMEASFRGRILKLAGDRTFEEWTVSFYNDIGFELRDAFERWQNGINSYSGNVGFNSPDEYMSTVSVYQLDRNDQRVKEYVLKLAWPMTVAPIEVSQESNDTIETFDVTFAYSDMSSNTTS